MVPRLELTVVSTAVVAAVVPVPPLAAGVDEVVPPPAVVVPEPQAAAVRASAPSKQPARTAAARRVPGSGPPRSPRAAVAFLMGNSSCVAGTSKKPCHLPNRRGYGAARTPDCRRCPAVRRHKGGPGAIPPAGMAVQPAMGRAAAVLDGSSDEALLAGMALGDERAGVAFVRRYQR